jgi:hypothetical protein
LMFRALHGSEFGTKLGFEGKEIARIFAGPIQKQFIPNIYSKITRYLIVSLPDISFKLILFI